MERRQFLIGTIAGALTATSAPFEPTKIEEPFLGNDAIELFKMCQHRLRERYSARVNHPAQIDMPKRSRRLLAEIQSIDCQKLTRPFLKLGRIQAILRQNGCFATIFGGFAGSLVAFSLGWTPVCPIESRLRFDGPMCLGENSRFGVYRLIALTSHETLRFLTHHLLRHPRHHSSDHLGIWRNSGDSIFDLELSPRVTIRFAVTRRSQYIQTQSKRFGLPLARASVFDLPQQDPDECLVPPQPNREDRFPYIGSGLIDLWRIHKPKSLDELAQLVALDYALVRSGTSDDHSMRDVAEAYHRFRRYLSEADSREFPILFTDDLVEIIHTRTRLSYRECWKWVAASVVNRNKGREACCQENPIAITSKESSGRIEGVREDLVGLVPYSLSRSRASGEASLAVVINWLRSFDANSADGSEILEV